MWCKRKVFRVVLNVFMIKFEVFIGLFKGCMSGYKVKIWVMLGGYLS